MCPWNEYSTLGFSLENGVGINQTLMDPTAVPTQSNSPLLPINTNKNCRSNIILYNKHNNYYLILTIINLTHNRGPNHTSRLI